MAEIGRNLKIMAIVIVVIPCNGNSDSEVPIDDYPSKHFSLYD